MIDFEADIPFYQQLKNQIIAGIATGKLKPGEPLPSVRQLAADLGINLHTVNKTYNLLRQDGYITIHRQKGVVVSTVQGPRLSEEFLEQLRSGLRPLLTEAFCRGLREKQLREICAAIYSELTTQGGK